MTICGVETGGVDSAHAANPAVKSARRSRREWRESLSNHAHAQTRGRRRSALIQHLSFKLTRRTGANLKQTSSRLINRAWGLATGARDVRRRFAATGVRRSASPSRRADPLYLHGQNLCDGSDLALWPVATRQGARRCRPLPLWLRPSGSFGINAACHARPNSRQVCNRTDKAGYRDRNDLWSGCTQGLA